MAALGDFKLASSYTTVTNWLIRFGIKNIFCNSTTANVAKISKFFVISDKN
jgi:hypothetical protein